VDGGVWVNFRVSSDRRAVAQCRQRLGAGNFDDAQVGPNAEGFNLRPLAASRRLAGVSAQRALPSPTYIS
jgi:hypothetical protein